MITVHNTIAGRPPHHPYRPPLGDSGETRAAHLRKTAAGAVFQTAKTGPVNR
jgi:hypothetical protein